jgi:uncharacterized membrane protein YfcA
LGYAAYCFAYALTGCGAGFLAGLLGVGGGAIIVPSLITLFTAQGLPSNYVVHMALGTSIASIIFTSTSSIRAHHSRGGIVWPIFWHIGAGVIIGTFLGSFVAARLSSDFLKTFFAVFIFLVAVQLFLDIEPKPSRKIPGILVLFGVGLLIGGISSWVGIGGGAMSVPFMVWCNVPIRKSIGTSAAIGLPIALSGAVGYFLSGLSVNSLPSYSLGFVYLPALFFISLTSVILAPMGAWLTHRLPASRLKKVFAILLSVVAVKMIWGLF